MLVSDRGMVGIDDEEKVTWLPVGVKEGGRG